MQVDLPWPPRALSPNARAHWGERSRAAKRYRSDCYMLCKAAKLKAPEGKLALIIDFVPPDRRARDDDNLIAAFKPGRDGLADALGIDDKLFHTRHRVSETPTKGGVVRVRLETLQPD